MTAAGRHQDHPARHLQRVTHLDKVLQRFEADKADIAEVTVFIVGRRANFEATGAALTRYFGDHRPANNTLGVAALAFPQQLIEVAATVVLGDGRPGT